MVVAVGVPPPVLSTGHADQAGRRGRGVAPHALAVGDGRLGQRRLERPEGLEAGHGADGGDRPDLPRPPFRGARGGGRGVGDRAVGPGVGAGQWRDVAAGGQLAGRLGRRDQPPLQIVDLAANLRDPDLLVAHEAQPDPARALGHVLVDLVAGKPGQRFLVVDHGHLGAVPPHPLEDRVGERQEVVARRGTDHEAAVTDTLRKRQGAAPWPTWMTWPGCPLPQLTTPHGLHSEGPATASQDRQNSGVRPA